MQFLAYRRVVEVAVRYEGPRGGVADLVEFATDDTQFLPRRVSALRNLAEMPREALGDFNPARLETLEGHERLRLHALCALENLDPPRAQRMALRLLEFPEEQVRSAALLCLGRLGAATVDLLLSLMRSDPSRIVRGNVLELAFKVEERDRAEIIEAALADPSRLVRRVARIAQQKATA